MKKDWIKGATDSIKKNHTEGVCTGDKLFQCSDGTCVANAIQCSSNTSSLVKTQINQALKNIDNARKSLSSSSLAGRIMARKILIFLNRIKLILNIQRDDCAEKVNDALNSLTGTFDQVGVKTCSSSSRETATLKLKRKIIADKFPYILTTIQTDADNLVEPILNCLKNRIIEDDKSTVSRGVILKYL